MEPQVEAAAHESGERLPLEVYRSHGTSAGIDWTELREGVFRWIWGAGKPLGAYETATQLSKPGRLVHTNSVYRCLSCFATAGLILPIVSWKRYLLSPNPAVAWWGVLLCRYCRSCATFALTEEHEALVQMLEGRGFVPHRHSAECEGRCRACERRESLP